MRTYQNMHVSCQQTGKDAFPSFSFDGTGQQFDSDIHSEKQFLYRFIMLVCQNFGRCHHTRLITIIQGKQHAHQGNERFPATYIPLQKTVHLPSAAYVVANFFQYPFLRPCQLKRQVLCIKRIEYVAYFLKDIAAVSPLSVFGIAEDIELYIKQFLEFKTILRPAKQVRVCREVDIPKSFRERHQMMFRQ